MKPRPERPRVALLTPVFNEEESLRDFADTVRRVVLDRDDIDAGVLFVDDGSSDRSWSVVTEICGADRRFKAIRLSRNFGSHTAIWAAFMNLDPDTDAAVVLACDLQDPPETALELVTRWREGADIVWGVRKTRRESAWRVMTSRLFESALRRYALPPGSLFTTGSFLLTDSRVIAAVRQMREHNRITFALVAWTGFDQVRVEYERRERRAGRSGWTFGAMVKAMYDAFIGFSALPIRIMTVAALISFAVTVVLSVYLVVDVVVRHPIPGWTSQMLITAVFFGLQFSLMAIMGEYLYRIYSEVLRRPSYFISDSTFGAPEWPSPGSRASDSPRSPTATPDA